MTVASAAVRAASAAPAAAITAAAALVLRGRGTVLRRVLAIAAAAARVASILWFTAGLPIVRRGASIRRGVLGRGALESARLEHVAVLAAANLREQRDA